MGITNTRLSAAKRRIALELALRLIDAADVPVCVVGADPTDRDVERRMFELVQSGRHQRIQVRKGPRVLDVLMFEERRLCAVSVPDASAVDVVMPELRANFRYVVVDAPSQVGIGIGIAPRLPRHLQLLAIASCVTSDELAATRLYLDRLAMLPRAKHLDVRVISTGDPIDGGLGESQIERRLAALPTLARIPRLWGRGTTVPPPQPEDIDRAFEPLVKWIARRSTVGPSTSLQSTTLLGSHLANALYAGERRHPRRPDA